MSSDTRDISRDGRGGSEGRWAEKTMSTEERDGGKKADDGDHP